MRGLAPKLFRLPKISHSLAESVLANFGFGTLGMGLVILSFIRDVNGWGRMDVNFLFCSGNIQTKQRYFLSIWICFYCNVGRFL